MKTFVIALALVASVQSRPEPPVGYQYPSPSGTIGTGTLPLGSNVHFNEQSSSQSSATSGGLSANEGYYYNNAATSGSSSSVNSASQQIDFNSQFSSSATSALSGSGAVQVHKHVYFHVAPEDPEEPKANINIQQAPAQKHYKIIFIKAPSYGASASSIVAPQPQIEEKTLVYVLVKKPDDQEQIVLPTAATTKPSKPEVYFIKYKLKKGESTGASENQLSSAAVESGSTHDISETFSSTSDSFSTGNRFSGGLSTSYGPPGAGGPY